MYNVDDHALPDGNINENYQFLFSPVNVHKTRFIRLHLPVLKEYAEKCETIVEMGVDGVNSTWAFLAAKPNRIISIDIQNVKAPKILSLACALAGEAGIIHEFFLGDTLDINIPEVDMLFIDTDHTYNQLRGELARHADKVRKYIACHDTFQFPEMTVALTEFLRDHAGEWKTVYHTDASCGLTIIERI